MRFLSLKSGGLYQYEDMVFGEQVNIVPLDVVHGLVRLHTTNAFLIYLQNYKEFAILLSGIVLAKELAIFKNRLVTLGRTQYRYAHDGGVAHYRKIVVGADEKVNIVIPDNVKKDFLESVEKFFKSQKTNFHLECICRIQIDKTTYNNIELSCTVEGPQEEHKLDELWKEFRETNKGNGIESFQTFLAFIKDHGYTIIEEDEDNENKHELRIHYN